MPRTRKSYHTTLIFWAMICQFWRSFLSTLLSCNSIVNRALKIRITNLKIIKFWTPKIQSMFLLSNIRAAKNPFQTHWFGHHPYNYMTPQIDIMIDLHVTYQSWFPNSEIWTHHCEILLWRDHFHLYFTFNVPNITRWILHQSLLRTLKFYYTFDRNYRMENILK